VEAPEAEEVVELEEEVEEVDAWRPICRFEDL